MEAEFERACDYLSRQHSKLDQSVLLELYGSFKQATAGNCDVPKPFFLDFIALKKWKSWRAKINLSKGEAMRLYVNTLSQAAPNWREEDDNEDEKSAKDSWVSVSTMQCEETAPSDRTKNVFDWVVENNLRKLEELRGCGKLCGNERDGDGLSLLHWAADRGHLDIARFLIEHVRIDVNGRDSENQTPLHYAASCGHVDICRLLIQSGADLQAKDDAGHTPKDVAETPGMLDDLK